MPTTVRPGRTSDTVNGASDSMRRCVLLDDARNIAIIDDPSRKLVG